MQGTCVWNTHQDGNKIRTCGKTHETHKRKTNNIKCEQIIKKIPKPKKIIMCPSPHLKKKNKVNWACFIHIGSPQWMLIKY